MKRGRPRKVSDEQIVAALEANEGYMTQAAKSLGVAVSVFLHRRDVSDAVREAYLALKRKRIEHYERLLDACADAGSVNAIMFALERLCPEEYGKKTADTQVNVSTNVGIAEFVKAAQKSLEVGDD